MIDRPRLEEATEVLLLQWRFPSLAVNVARVVSTAVVSVDEETHDHKVLTLPEAVLEASSTTVVTVVAQCELRAEPAVRAWLSRKTITGMDVLFSTTVS